MPATLATVQKSVIHLMNANTSGTYNTSITDDRFTAGLIDEAIFSADEQVVLAILETVGHFARPDYLAASSSLTHGAEIPAHVGSLGQVLIDGVPGVEAPAEAIVRYRENDSASYGTGSGLTGMFHISEEDVIYFTGTAATVRIASYTRSAALQSPGIYTGAVVCGAVAMLLKEGGNAERAAYYGQLFSSHLQMIRANKKAIPELVMAS